MYTAESSRFVGKDIIMDNKTVKESAIANIIFLVFYVILYFCNVIFFRDEMAWTEWYIGIAVLAFEILTMIAPPVFSALSLISILRGKSKRTPVIFCIISFVCILGSLGSLFLEAIAIVGDDRYHNNINTVLVLVLFILLIKTAVIAKEHKDND